MPMFVYQNSAMLRMLLLIAQFIVVKLAKKLIKP